MPVKWYGTLALIVVIGVLAIVYSRYEREHPGASGPPPTIGQHWYAALAVDICGNVQPDLAANPNSTSNPGIHTDGDGVIRIEPTKAADAGNNATLARFVADYPKFGLTSTSLTVPGEKARTNGEKCPKGTPDSGKAGTVAIKMWPSSTAPGVNQPVTTTDASGLKLADGQLITIGFVPAGTALPKPSATTITTMVQAISDNGTTTTSAPIGTSTTVPASSSTTAASSSTTAPASTTTTAPATTTTVASKSTTTSAGGQPSR
ncbi:MAG: hypothetical protein ACRDY1_01065 [Acidimicrobiales bacterium]